MAFLVSETNVGVRRVRFPVSAVGGESSVVQRSRRESATVWRAGSRLHGGCYQNSYGLINVCANPVASLPRAVSESIITYGRQQQGRELITPVWP